MRLSIGTLRSLIRESVKRSDAAQVAAALLNAAAKVGVRVVPDVDSSGHMFNVFVRLVSGDPELAEPALVDAAQALGWILLSRSERRGTVWWFEPSAEIKGHVRSLPDTLWHLSPSENVDSIMSFGLEPRQRSAPGGSSRRYAPRVYFATDPGAAKAAVKTDQREWTLLKVDRRALPKGMKFYVDQEFGHRKDGTPLAVYALDQIPPNAISRA